MNDRIIIRAGIKNDLPRTLELIKELAEYERGLDQVNNTVARMEEEGFGNNPVFGFFVAEANFHIVGIAVYYYRYSTWKGKRLYLEDIVVTESQRGKGVGKMLFDRILKKVLEDGCSGIMWQVLDWNEPAINFYKKYNAHLDNGWLNCHLDETEIKTLLGV